MGQHDISHPNKSPLFGDFVQISAIWSPFQISSFLWPFQIPSFWWLFLNLLFLVTFSKSLPLWWLFPNIFFLWLFFPNLFFLVTFSKSPLLLILASGRWGDSCSTDGQFTLSRFLLYFLPYFSYTSEEISQWDFPTQTKIPTHAVQDGKILPSRSRPRFLHIFATFPSSACNTLKYSSTSSLCSAELLGQFYFERF